MLSVILPIRVDAGNAYLLDRLAANLTLFGGDPRVECVVVDSASPGRHGERIRELCRRERCRLVIDPDPQRPFAPGSTRNAGAIAASGDLLLFYDVDLCVGPGFVDQVLRAMGPAPAWNDFLVVPSLFLTRGYTATIDFRGQPIDLAPALASLLAGESDKVESLGLTHLVVPRRTFLRLGGNRPEYRGHGCEDFDVLHRLASYRPLGARPDDYALDHRTHFPGDYRGFRAYLARYGLPYLFEGPIAAHLWHGRPLIRSYFRQRDRNEALLQDFMRRHDAGETPAPLADPDDRDAPALPTPWSGSTLALPSLTDSIIAAMSRHGLDVERHPGLFRWRPGGAPTIGGRRRKLRKLLLRPRQFFADSRLPFLRYLSKRLRSR